MNIKIEKPVVDVENLLNLIGKEFRFDHAKGLSEWLKNSIDAYTLESVPDEEQIIYIVLETVENHLLKSISVIDFVGMTRDKIDKAFKIWFDPSAAKTTNELLKKDIKTLGGHGNGGKFYMREMFKTSQIITYRNNRINIFGFNEKKQYGFHEEFDNKQVPIESAIAIANIDKIENLYPNISSLLHSKKRFTIVKGLHPKAIAKTHYLNKLMDGLIVHPQARRIIQRKKVFLLYDKNINPKRLQTPSISPKLGFEKPREFICPKEFITETETISMFKDEKQPIKLILYSSEVPLKGHKYKGLNTIDFLSSIGVIASYEITELGYVASSNFSEFIYGECFCEIMETEDLVRNDRDKFVPSAKTNALLDWVKNCLQSFCQEMDDQIKKERKKIDLQQTSLYNELLNRWKNRFLNKLFKEGLGGNGMNPGMDGNSENELIFTSKSKLSNHKRQKQSGDSGGDKKTRGNKFPEVKISGRDIDPVTGEVLYLDSRQFAVHQRPVDFEMGIYWINTSKKFAQLILEKYTANSIHWREYLFQRYMDIIIKETIHNKGKQEVDLTADVINTEIDNRISEILDLAAEDLRGFLFENDFEI
ncbi:MAG TPA: ATP-binding protein [Ignavibacteriaceae bacterium]|nr:ATP-binding protein [Ignavibacteriaceae bacterium]